MIEGIVLTRLKTHSDERGFFREVFRFSENFKGISVGQLSHSLVKEGVVKGWHGHTVQFQWNYVVTGLTRVALLDDRVDSPTFRETMEFLVGEGQEPSAYYFPPGVLHGYKCLKGPMQIIYVTSDVYDSDDEVRIQLSDRFIKDVFG